MTRFVPSRAHEKENLRLIEEQISTVIDGLRTLKSKVHFPKWVMTHCIPCLGWFAALWFIH
jgi:hypothetical protein